MPRHLVRAGLAAALSLLAACDYLVEPSDAVDQDRIYTEYELQYDGDADVTAARATFRFGGASGTPLELSDESDVLVDGRALSPRRQPITGTTYYERSAAGYVPSGTFEFVDAEGTTYVNAAQLRPLAAPTSLGPIDNDVSAEVRWTGAPLAAGEEVTAVLYRLVGGGALAVFTQRDVGATSVILDRAQLQNVTPGTATLVLERRATRDLDESPSAGGRMTTRYTAEPVRVDVVE